MHAQKSTGAGKSTLVKIMIGAENFDAGTIGRPVGVEKFQARKILLGLGFTESESEKTNHFSGGESAKIYLAKALLNKPRILILDEPTNHLDIYAIDSPENFGRNYRGTLIAAESVIRKNIGATPAKAVVPIPKEGAA